MKTTVLLGAGASMDAGLPRATQLTERLSQHVVALGRPDVTAAFHAVVGGIIAWDTGHGRNPFAGVDSERVFEAITLLAARDDVNMASSLVPFVASWIPSIVTMGKVTDFPVNITSNMSYSLSEGNDGLMEVVLKQAIASAAGIRHPRDTLGQLVGDIVTGLGGILSLDAGRSSYLTPLLRPQPTDTVQIVSLNYDLALEQAASESGISIDRGIEQWSDGSIWSWGSDRAAVRLLKLHGSIDWHYVGGRPRHGGEELPSTRIEVGNIDGIVLGLANSRAIPALIFGLGTKLRSDGPFMPMLNAFAEMLRESDRLVVIGYSFRDEHVNTALRQWTYQGHRDGLVVIDPSASDEWSPFMEKFVNAHQERIPGSELQWDWVMRNPHRLIRRGAADGIAELFGSES